MDFWWAIITSYTSPQSSGPFKIILSINKAFTFFPDAQSLNYNSGLMRYNQMVTTTNFSEISSFMPGIKTLLQLGMQLRV